MSAEVGPLESLAAFEAQVEKVLGDGRMRIKLSSGATEVIPAVYFGGVSGTGLFQHPDEGDYVLCVRVHPGNRGCTQAIRVIPAEGREKSSDSVKHDASVASGSTSYPILNLSPGDVKLASRGGGELFLAGDALNSDVFLGNSQKGGIYVSTDNVNTSVTTVSHNIQTVSSGARIISGNVIRTLEKNNEKSCGHELTTYCNIDGTIRGIWPGIEGSEFSVLGRPRNPTISEYRMVINEISEQAAYDGWDNEAAASFSKSRKEYVKDSDIRAIDSTSSLQLSPHQLVEIIGGNVVNTRGEVLDINYGSVDIGNPSGGPPTTLLDFEHDRLSSRRGIGYHFQLSTNSLSTESSNDTSNFAFGIDKEGVLKVSVPRTTLSGNVLYPTAAQFAHYSGGIYTSPLKDSAQERIPITLRDAESNIVLPQVSANSAIFSSNKRDTGVRFTNEDGYFQNVKNILDAGGGKKVRVNSTAYHNMYAAAEMLIANKIKKVIIPSETTECPGIVKGHSCGEPFERLLAEIDGAGKSANDIKFMSTVAVEPGKPAINPGGGTVVGGMDYTDEKGGVNSPYTNSFKVGSAGPINVDKSGYNRKSPGGKSANMNFEGAVEVSIGKDDYDEKSLVLDTAGSLVAWFGKDRNNRSVVVQTDGDVAVNVGGRSIVAGADKFVAGRFDLRVNVTDKGYIGIDKKWCPEGGHHASDYIISISDAGIVIAGMNPGAPMIIRNDGDLSIESTAKLSLGASSVEIREGNRPPRKSHKDPASCDTPEATATKVPESIKCITDLLSDLTD